MHLPDQHSVHAEDDFLSPYSAMLVGALWRLGLSWQDQDVAAVANAIGTSVLDKFFGDDANELYSPAFVEVHSPSKEDYAGARFRMDNQCLVQPAIPTFEGVVVDSADAGLSFIQFHT